MFKTILVPLDGSKLAESALPYAEAVGRAVGARLVLLRAAQARSATGEAREESQVTATSAAEIYVQEVGGRVSALGLEVETVVPYGDAAEMILAEARLRNADLIVMATHGRTGLGRMVFGSVADKVLRHTTVPLLLVPSTCRHFLGADGEPRVLVTVDGSSRSELVLGPAGDLAVALGGRLALLEVASQGSPGDPSASQRSSLLLLNTAGQPSIARDSAEGHLECLAAALRHHGRPVEIHAVTGDPASTIVSEAQSQGVDVIAMATHGRGGLARAVMGSVTSEVLKRACLPLLLVRSANGQAASS